MRESSKSRHFQKFGPMIDGVALLDKHASEFVASLSASAPERRISSALSKIAKALNTRDFADAAIRFAHVEKLIKIDGVVAFSKANFDPSQPRNAIGEWSETGHVCRLRTTAI